VKTCKNCNETKEVAEFPVVKNHGHYIQYRAQCKVCWAKWKSENHKKNPAKYDKDKQRAGWHRRAYGLEPDDYERMREAQNGRCAVCKEEAKLVVDHCHDSLVVRGLLCGPCNTGLGMFRDNAGFMREAANYVSAFQ
jgi:hypothetical protein